MRLHILSASIAAHYGAVYRGPTAKISWGAYLRSGGPSFVSHLYSQFKAAK